MKKLQSNFTTPLQSKWLLELGVPADSADCIFTRFSRDEKWKRRFIEDIISTQLFFNGRGFYLPCWSVGRLIEICLKCSTLEQRQVRFVCDGDDDEYSLIDYVITVLEGCIMTNHIDFSKLED